MSSHESIPIADNIGRVRNVCLSPTKPADGGLDSQRRRRAVQARVHWRAAHAQAWEEYCMHQTSCHTAAALKFCLDTRKRATRPAAVRFIEEHTGFAVSEADTSEVYPPASANRVQRAAVVMVTGNIGHDLLSLLDIFSQQQVARRARVFDALILEGFWFAGVGGFQTALQSPRQSWTLAMIDALLNTSHHGQQRGTHAVPTYAVEYSPRRRTRLSRFRRAGDRKSVV